MILIPFDSMRDIHANLTKASEANLPDDERRGVFIPGDDPLELQPALTVAEERAIDRQMARFAVSSKPSMPSLKGGQGHSGAEIEQDARELLVVLGLAVAALLGIGCAELIAHAADAIGAAYLAN
jgi:hypothetical protein